MYNYKEIVTKAIIGKGKKTFKSDHEVIIETPVDTVLGCWVINNKLSGLRVDDKIKIKGSYDINIWYSYDNNTKTNVISKREYYEEIVKVRIRENGDLNNDSEIIIRALKNPSCIDVSNTNNVIKYTISKELGIEVVGDTKVKIAVANNEDDYDIIDDEADIDSEIDSSVNTEYIKDSN